MSRPALAIISGWGASDCVWQKFVHLAEQEFEITLLSLPGYQEDFPLAAAMEDYQASVIRWLLERLPLNSVLCGWSLGGMLAARIAQQYPNRVSHLVSLCSNPKFVVANDWPHAMATKVFSGFQTGVDRQPELTLQRFNALICQGASSQQRDLRELNNLTFPALLASNPHLPRGLELLDSIDVRPDLSAISQPTLHVLGERDALVTQTVAVDIQALRKNAQVTILPDCAHVPMLSQPQKLLDRIIGFLRFADASREVAHAG